jgi:hypothetical protein
MVVILAPAFLHMMLRLVKGIAKPNTSTVDWQHSLIGPCGLQFVVSHLVFSFMGEVGKNK